MGRHLARGLPFLRSLSRIGGWLWNPLPPRNSVAAPCRLDQQWLPAPAPRQDEAFAQHHPLHNSDLRLASSALGDSQCPDVSRNAIPHSEILHPPWRNRSAWLDGLGKHLALPCQGLLPRPVENKRGSH